MRSPNKTRPIAALLTAMMPEDVKERSPRKIERIADQISTVLITVEELENALRSISDPSERRKTVLMYHRAGELDAALFLAISWSVGKRVMTSAFEEEYQTKKAGNRVFVNYSAKHPSREHDNNLFRMAARFGDESLVKRLLQEKRVDPTTYQNYAFRHAAANGHVGIVKTLLDHGHLGDIRAWDNFARRHALANGHTAMIELLDQYESQT